MEKVFSCKTVYEKLEKDKMDFAEEIAECEWFFEGYVYGEYKNLAIISEDERRTFLGKHDIDCFFVTLSSIKKNFYNIADRLYVAAKIFAEKEYPEESDYDKIKKRAVEIMKEMLSMEIGLLSRHKDYKYHRPSVEDYKYISSLVSDIESGKIPEENIEYQKTSDMSQEEINKLKKEIEELKREKDERDKREALWRGKYIFTEVVECLEHGLSEQQTIKELEAKYKEQGLTLKEEGFLFRKFSDILRGDGSYRKNGSLQDSTFIKYAQKIKKGECKKSKKSEEDSKIESKDSEVESNEKNG